MGLTAAISLLSLLAPSGIGHAYQLYPITMVVVLVLFALFPLGRALHRGQAGWREFFLTLGLMVVMVIWPAVKGQKTLGLEYAWMLTVPYVVGQLSFSQKDIRAIGFSAGICGLIVVVARLYLGIFGGWNNNAIAMAGFLGAAVYTAVRWETWGMKIFGKILLVAMTLMMLQLDSRSCVTGCLLLTVFEFDLINPRLFVKKNWLRRLMLVLPMLIAVGTVLFQRNEIFNTLNTWSMEYFNKPIFNGRNTIWEYGMEIILKDPLLGTGQLSSGYWHNCAITIATAFGLLGFALWVLYFENIMVEAHRWPKDPCFGPCIASFAVILIQQSFELGLVSVEGSMLPYLILGMMLGRMRYLKNKESL